MNFLFPLYLLLTAITLPLFSYSEDRQEVISTEKPRLLLIYSPRCPYCQKVLAFLKKQNKAIPLCNVLEQRECVTKLYDLGKKGIVPCLLIDEVPLFDAEAIIDWLQENKKSFEECL